MTAAVIGAWLVLAWLLPAEVVEQPVTSQLPSFEQLLATPVALKPELAGIHPRVFVTSAEIDRLRARARTSHREHWTRVLHSLPALHGDPPPPPGPQERRSQNNVAFAVAGASLAYAVEQDPKYLAAAKRWLLAAIDYEPWGYTYNKPNVDLAAGHLLYALGWSYDLLYNELSPSERARIRASLERHAGLVYEYFSPSPGKKFPFTQNHNFIPTSGLAVTALALMGESADAPKWAALARAHLHRATTLLSPDGYYYEGMEYWIFSVPWLVHFYDAWEHATGESLWHLGPAKAWTAYLAHVLLPDGQNVFDFGDIWEGALTRAKRGAEYSRVYPGGTLQSNFNLIYRVASRFNDPLAQAIADRYASFGHSNLEEYWTLIWRDEHMAAAPIDRVPLFHHFADSGVVFYRTSWKPDAIAVAFKAGPPEGHRVAKMFGTLPEWRLDSGHAHPDAGGFVIWADGHYFTGDTGYAGQPHARHHNTLTIGGAGQGSGDEHDVWRRMDQRALDGIRIVSAERSGAGFAIAADAAAAYPSETGLQTFRRSFTFDGRAVFTVRDRVETREAKTVEWYLQSDREPRRDGGSYALAGPASSLAISIKAPADGITTTGPTILTAPGKPGSITEGAQEQRGFHLRIATPARQAADFHVELRLVRPDGSKNRH